MVPVSKHEVLAYSVDYLEEKINEIKVEIEKVNEDAARETKSSMGDKYETGREMIVQEQIKLTERLDHLLMQKMVIGLIDEGSHKVIKQGSLVQTSQGLFFIATALGAIKLNGKQIFILSQDAPLAREMMGKKEGDTISFNQRSQQILQVS